MIQGLFDEIQSRIGDFFRPLFNYLYLAEWWALVVGGLLVALVVSYFLPFRWARVTMGALWVLLIAFVAGVTHASGHFREELDKQKKKIRELESQRRSRQSWWP